MISASGPSRTLEKPQVDAAWLPETYELSPDSDWRKVAAKQAAKFCDGSGVMFIVPGWSGAMEYVATGTTSFEKRGQACTIFRHRRDVHNSFITRNVSEGGRAIALAATMSVRNPWYANFQVTSMSGDPYVSFNLSTKRSIYGEDVMLRLRDCLKPEHIDADIKCVVGDNIVQIGDLLLKVLEDGKSVIPVRRRLEEKTNLKKLIRPKVRLIRKTKVGQLMLSPDFCTID